jgi:hypothetical protein
MGRIKKYRHHKTELLIGSGMIDLRSYFWIRISCGANAAPSLWTTSRFVYATRGNKTTIQAMTRAIPTVVTDLVSIQLLEAHAVIGAGMSENRTLKSGASRRH